MGGAAARGCQGEMARGCGCPLVRDAGTRWSSIWAEIFGEMQNSVDFVVGRVGIVG